MPVGENDRSAHVAQQKAPEVATPGLFYSVLGGWLNPKAGYQLFFSVQPFADVVGNYTCFNKQEKGYKQLQESCLLPDGKSQQHNQHITSVKIYFSQPLQTEHPEELNLRGVLP